MSKDNEILLNKTGNCIPIVDTLKLEKNKTLVDRIKFTNDFDDKEYLSDLLGSLPYNLINGNFDLIARYESFVGTVGIFPADKYNLIELVSFEEKGNYRFTCNFEEGYVIITNSGGSSIVIYRKHQKNARI